MIETFNRYDVEDVGEVVESVTHSGLLRESGDYDTIQEVQADEGPSRAPADDQGRGHGS